MKNKEDNTDLIEAYLNDELAENERNDFENHLKLDADLAAEVALHKQIRAFVKENEVQNLKSQVKDWLKDDAHVFVATEMKVIKKPFFSMNNIARIAAAVAIVSGIGWFYFSNKTPEMTAEVAQNQYFTELLAQNPGTLQGTDDRSTWTQAFREKQFDKVIEILEKGIDKTTEEVYYLGLAYSAKGNYPKAIEQFSTKIVHDSVYAEKANWAIALIYLKQNNKTEAKVLLEKIAKSDSEFSEKAKELLK